MRRVGFMMNTTNTAAAARIRKLDKLTREHTAFANYNHLTDTCREGYVPTLRQPQLVAALKADGFRTWG
jgi:hypothetical protein